MEQLKFSIMQEVDLEETVSVAISAFGSSCEQDAVRDFQYSLEGTNYSPITLIARDSERILGAVQVVWAYLMPDTYTIAWLCVLPACQGRGIGSNLMSKAISYSENDLLKGSAGTIYLSALVHASYYEKMGFMKGPKNHHGAEVMLRLCNCRPGSKK